jgi:hypothetical protein
MAKASYKEKPLLPEPGERAFIAGQTGSGKTAFGVWLLERLEMSPAFIYDTKEETKFDTLPHSKVVTTLDEADEAYADQTLDYIIVRPPINVTSDPRALDDWLYHHWQFWRKSVAYLDETSMFHTNGRGGPGLLALMTRGRSREITVIMSTQRPAWISQFMISEAQKFYIFFLQIAGDKKRISEVLPNFDKLANPPKHGFYFFKAGESQVTKYGAVKLAKAQNTGYTDPDPLPASDAPAPKRRADIWI